MKLLNVKKTPKNVIKNVFIHPGMDDGGLAVGAALLVSHKKDNTETCLTNVYLGPDYSQHVLSGMGRNTGPDGACFVVQPGQ